MSEYSDEIEQLISKIASRKITDDALIPLMKSIAIGVLSSALYSGMQVYNTGDNAPELPEELKALEMLRNSLLVDAPEIKAFSDIARELIGQLGIAEAKLSTSKVISLDKVTAVFADLRDWLNMFCEEDRESSDNGSGAK